MKVCSIEGCSKKVFCRGLCSTHYVRWQRHGDPFYRKSQEINIKKCKHPGCERLNEIGEYCTKHYQRYLKYGDTDDALLKNQATIHPKKRIELGSVVDFETGCWIWWRGKDQDGYGQFTFKDKPYRAHRVSYRLFVGKIPKGMCVLHTCDNPSCVNPEHLFLGTKTDNSNDKVQKNRQARGERAGHAKLTEDQVREIKRQLLGTKSISAIARNYFVSRRAISLIKAGTNWKHIKI